MSSARVHGMVGNSTDDALRGNRRQLQIAWRVVACCVVAAVCLAPTLVHVPLGFLFGFLRFAVGALSVVYGSMAVMFVCAVFRYAYGFESEDYPKNVLLRIAFSIAPFIVVVCAMGLKWSFSEWVSFDVGGAFAIGGVVATPFAVSALWGWLAESLPVSTDDRTRAVPRANGSTTTHDDSLRAGMTA